MLGSLGFTFKQETSGRDKFSTVGQYSVMINGFVALHFNVLANYSF
jgi:hypothetical protein